MTSKLKSVLVSVLALTGVWLYALPEANLAYVAAVLLHLAAGLVLAIVIPFVFVGNRRGFRRVALPAWILLAAGAAIGLVLVFTGTARPYSGWLNGHIAASVIGAALLAAHWLRIRSRGLAYGVVALAAAGIAAGAWAVRTIAWQSGHVINNPEMPPAAMDGEGDGPKGLFFPSSAQTDDGKTIPSKYFMGSQSCERCHSDIYKQWSSSAHRFSSFNNQWYRKSIEYMQEVNGTRSPKWCAGCHDPAVLFSGMMEQPVANFIDKPEAHAGLGCVSCHSIVAVKSTMGQGDYVHEYPALHDLATSENKVVRAIHDFVVRVNPEPHRRAFMKPFVRSQTADFCSSCHKVHLDVPVNNYRWFRGFNDYDAWQASGVSGQGARSFYYPPKSQRCVDCHMPLVPSNDLGNVNGMVHSHRFPGANTALPIANEDKEQFDVVEKFLKDNIVTVDIFSVSSASPVSTTLDAPQEMATTFAVGEEADAAVAGQGAATHPATPITAPLDRVDAVVRRGDSARVDVVVRTRKVGHFFPGGTVDAFDVWVELQAVDDKGQVIFWSGKVDDEGRGPVDKTAHFYRSLQVDGHGNPINKRNAWSTRALVYTRLIPPGAADTVRYRLQIPKNAGDKIHLKARLHYRKFAWWNTQFAYAGIRDSEGQPHTPHYDDGRWIFTGDTSRVSGKLKKIPDLPIITIAQDEKTIRVAGSAGALPSPQTVLKADDWTRWNDYGIGLFLQGDLKNAEAAFTKITEIDPKNPDGWVNIGRVRVQEGNLEGAKEVLERALALSPDLARANFFYARTLRGEGKYEEALDRYRRVLAQYPRDRVVRNDAGRTLFLLRKYADAIKEFQYVLTIDPEDIQAHYNLMLCYNGLGQEDKAREHEKRYLRFKADESAQAITGPYRLSNPADNNERQAIHEHAGSN